MSEVSTSGSPHVSESLNTISLFEREVIARIDDRELQAQVERGEASLSLARAALARILAGARREEVHQAEARLEQAETNLVNAKQRFRRAQELFRQQLIAAQEREEAEALHEAARPQVWVAEEGLRIPLAEDRVEVVGIFESGTPEADNAVVLPLAQAQQLLQKPEVVHRVLIVTRPGTEVAPLKQALRRRLVER